MDRILGLNNRKLQPLLAKQLKSKMFHRLYPSYNFSVRDFRDHLLCLSLRLIFWKLFSRKILRKQQTPGQNKSPNKSVLKLVKPFSGHLLAKRNQRCPKRPFISRPLRCQSNNSFDMHTKQNFEISTFTFLFHPRLFFCIC